MTQETPIQPTGSVPISELEDLYDELESRKEELPAENDIMFGKITELGTVLIRLEMLIDEHSNEA